MSFRPRPKQADVLRYKGGWMGISAVPGSGKTRTLSYLAADLIRRLPADSNAEVLVVTLVNSAAGNFAHQVSEFTSSLGLLSGVGYRVRTLHGLANDIVRERPELAGLEDNFTILDERESDEILQDAVDAWVRTHADFLDLYIDPDRADNNWARNQWSDLAKTIASAVIKQAKDMTLTPADVRQLLNETDQDVKLLAMCADIYAAYERGLTYRAAVDFQDLIRLALKVLQADADYLARLQRRWVFVLEDEAQDSSKLQENILRLLVSKQGNWVRVGDPNQAIYETFTTANPKYLRDFLTLKNVTAKDLPNSGRMSKSIIKLANYLIEWSLSHPVQAVREKMPLSPPYIEPTPPDDPQGNPPDKPDQIFLQPDQYTSDEERQIIAGSVKRWLSENPDRTCAILLPSNASGAKMVDALRSAGVEFIELLRTTTPTRKVVGTIYRVLNYLLDPKDARRLADAYRVWRRDEADDPEKQDGIEGVVKLLRSIKLAEDFTAPRVKDWIESEVEDDRLAEHLQQFRSQVQRWQAAVDLPIDQLVLTITGDLFTKESEIATGYSLALHLHSMERSHPEMRLPEFVDETLGIARSLRKFNGLSDDDNAFDPDAYPGKVAVMTMHKAKGLEWDRVYLTSVSNYDFPALQGDEVYRGETWYIRDSLNLQAEALGQLNAVASRTDYREGQPTFDARVEYVAERLRLLYVGITRARQELVITFNTGTKGTNGEALALAALRGWWEKEQKRK